MCMFAGLSDGKVAPSTWPVSGRHDLSRSESVACANRRSLSPLIRAQHSQAVCCRPLQFASGAVAGDIE